MAKAGLNSRVKLYFVVQNVCKAQRPSWASTVCVARFYIIGNNIRQ